MGSSIVTSSFKPRVMVSATCRVGSYGSLIPSSFPQFKCSSTFGVLGLYQVDLIELTCRRGPNVFASLEVWLNDLAYVDIELTRMEDGCVWTGVHLSLVLMSSRPYSPPMFKSVSIQPK